MTKYILKQSSQKGASTGDEFDSDIEEGKIENEDDQLTQEKDRLRNLEGVVEVFDQSWKRTIQMHPLLKIVE